MLKSSFNSLSGAKVELHYTTCKMHHDGEIKMLEREITGVLKMRNYGNGNNPNRVDSPTYAALVVWESSTPRQQVLLFSLRR